MYDKNNTIRKCQYGLTPILNFEMNFCSNKRAESSSLQEQIDKVLEESNEIADAYNNSESSERIVEETLDCIQACEGILRKFGISFVDKQYQHVLNKCAFEYGDYS